MKMPWAFLSFCHRRKHSAMYSHAVMVLNVTGNLGSGSQALGCVHMRHRRGSQGVGEARMHECTRALCRRDDHENALRRY